LEKGGKAKGKQIENNNEQKFASRARSSGGIASENSQNTFGESSED
jgi:hypothetical protein